MSEYRLDLTEWEVRALQEIVFRWYEDASGRAAIWPENEPRYMAQCHARDQLGELHRKLRALASGHKTGTPPA